MSKSDTTKTFEEGFNSKYGDKCINEINNFIYPNSNEK